RSVNRRSSTISSVQEARPIFAWQRKSSGASAGSRPRHRGTTMVEKPSRLGRGLAALIGDMATGEGKRVAESLSSIKRLPVDFVIANRQNPRRDFDAASLEEL